jgi:hypothetical protein
VDCMTQVWQLWAQVDNAAGPSRKCFQSVQRDVHFAAHSIGETIRVTVSPRSERSLVEPVLNLVGRVPSQISAVTTSGHAVRRWVQLGTAAYFAYALPTEVNRSRPSLTSDNHK